MENFKIIGQLTDTAAVRDLPFMVSLAQILEELLNRQNILRKKF